MCRSTAIYPNGRCKFHGGPSFSGPANPAFKTGRFSKVLPIRLAAAYREALADPDLIGLRDEIAVTQARILELFAQLETGDPFTQLSRARQALVRFKQAAASKNQTAVTAAGNDLETALSGPDLAAVWTQLHDTIYLKKDLVDSEGKRLKDMHQMLSTERAMTLMAVIIDTIRRHVTDKAALSAISTDFQKLIGPSPLHQAAG